MLFALQACWKRTRTQVQTASHLAAMVQVRHYQHSALVSTNKLSKQLWLLLSVLLELSCLDACREAFMKKGKIHLAGTRGLLARL